MHARPDWLEIHPEVAAALDQGRPVVALETSLLAQGLPWPNNLHTARRAEHILREHKVVPASIAVWHGRPTIGLHEAQLEALADPTATVRKLSRRDLAGAIALRQTGATTVAATMFLAHAAGIRVFATGGIGGVHRGGPPWDVSADLLELARTPVAVVCAGAKSILDLPQTLEMLETLGVPVIGYGTDTFPGFWLRSTGQAVALRVDTVPQVVAVLQAHWHLQGGGVVVAQPLPEEVALPADEWQQALDQAEQRALSHDVRGADRTPYLLRQLAELTAGKTVRANQTLVEANVQLAAEVACALAGYCEALTAP